MAAEDIRESARADAPNEFMAQGAAISCAETCRSGKLGPRSWPLKICKAFRQINTLNKICTRTFAGQNPPPVTRSLHQRWFTDEVIVTSSALVARVSSGSYPDLCFSDQLLIDASP